MVIFQKKNSRKVNFNSTNYKIGYKKSIGITNKDLDKLIMDVDTNHNNEINFTEFMVASLDRKMLLTDQRIEACFKLFDKVKISF